MKLRAHLLKIEMLLEQLIAQQAMGTTPSLSHPGSLRSEIDRVKAAGGDLKSHFREKARAQMSREKKERKR